MTELADLSRRNDELLAAKDDDLAHIRELEGQVKEYKRKYEQAKTELRSAKGTIFHHYLLTSMLIYRACSDLAVVPPAAQSRRPAPCCPGRRPRRHSRHWFRLFG